MSVVTPVVVPLTTTVAPTIVAPLSSRTTPLSVRDTAFSATRGHGTARDDDAPSVYFIAHVLSREDLREDVLDRFVLRRDRDPTLHVDLAGIDRKRIVRLLQGGDRPLHGYVFQVQGDVVSRRLRRQKQRRRHNDSETKRFYTRNR